MLITKYKVLHIYLDDIKKKVKKINIYYVIIHQYQTFESQDLLIIIYVAPVIKCDFMTVLLYIHVYYLVLVLSYLLATASDIFLLLCLLYRIWFGCGRLLHMYRNIMKIRKNFNKAKQVYYYIQFLLYSDFFIFQYDILYH